MQGGSGRVPEWLSTHPDPENRSEAILAMADDEGIDLSTAVVARPAFLRQVDGMIFGANPREGFTEGDVFHHPDLAFRLNVPSGWHVVNGKREVQFLTPQQDGAVLLTLAAGSPRDAIAAFGAQNGIRMGSPRSRTVNGFDAVSAPFEAETQQGMLAGEALFLSYGGNTYRMLGVAAASNWPSLAPDAGALMLSFQRETDSRVLGVQPDRLSLVDLNQSLSLAVFVERYPSAVPSEVVALINHVAPGGTLPAGLAKRVQGAR
jgi:predicted Zn-dependent protease